MYPHVCPVCQGRGSVALGFYGTTTGFWSGSNLTTEPCRSCGGTGVIWTHPIPPQQFTYGTPRTTGGSF